jgi:hypothetical protein
MLTRFLKWNLMLTDLGFIAYWSFAALQIFPAEWLYKDAEHPLMQAWNWSFAPVDLMASGVGLWALWDARRGGNYWRFLLPVSLSMTVCAGLMALSFWAIRGDVDLAWWLPNLYLLTWPMFAVPSCLKNLR